MSSELGDRTQKPTERRRREARARGEVARSADLVAACMLLAATTSLWWLGADIGKLLAVMVGKGLSTVPQNTLTAQTATESLTGMVLPLAQGLAPVFLIPVAAAVIGSLVQTGFLFVPTVLSRKLVQFDPSEEFRRWMAWHSWITLGASVLKLLVLGVVLYVFVLAHLPFLAGLTESQPSVQLHVTAGLLIQHAVLLSMTVFVLALLDYGYQFWRHEQHLMMTVEELRREQREDSMDPRFKRTNAEGSGQFVAHVTSEHF